MTFWLICLFSRISYCTLGSGLGRMLSDEYAMVTDVYGSTRVEIDLAMQYKEQGIYLYVGTGTIGNSIVHNFIFR